MANVRGVKNKGREFWKAAVERMNAGENVRALSRELGVDVRGLYRWRERLQAKETDPRFRGSPSKTTRVTLQICLTQGVHLRMKTTPGISQAKSFRFGDDGDNRGGGGDRRDRGIPLQQSKIGIGWGPVIARNRRNRKSGFIPKDAENEKERRLGIDCDGIGIDRDDGVDHGRDDVVMGS